MTKEQIRKDSQDTPIEKSPSSEKVSKGKPPIVNRKKFSAIVSNRLMMNPPTPSLSETSEKQDDLVFSGNEETDSEDELWFRKFVTQRLEIDAPAPDPPKGNENSPIIPVSPDPNSNESVRPTDSALSVNLDPFGKSISNLINSTNIETRKNTIIKKRDYSAITSSNIKQKSIDNRENETHGNKIHGNGDIGADRPESSTKGKVDSRDNSVNRTVSDKQNGKERIFSSKPAFIGKRNIDRDSIFPKHNPTPKGNDDNKIVVIKPFYESEKNEKNKKNDIASRELVSGFETSSNSSIDKEDGAPISEKEESTVTPEVKPKRKANWIFISILLVMVFIVGAWTLRYFAFGQYSNNETKGAYSQPKPTDIPVLIFANDVSSDEIDSAPAAFGSTDPPTATPNPPDYDLSVLTQTQKDRLYKASLTYLADDEEAAVYIARSIDYVPNEGHPATMCGPLAISILRDALLIDRYVDLKGFWLLNPRDDYTVRAILEKYFPREDYQWYQTSTPINYYDFKSYPLYTGDFLYLFAGRGGTFEHMIVVTRVDDAGRAYSVSAQEDSNGYSIKEVMLYDPNNPGEGYFYEITDSANGEFGVTGLGGFWMWRRLTTYPEVNLDDVAFSDQLDSVLNESGGVWHVYIKEIDGRVIYSLEAQEVIHPASVIKVPLAIQFFQVLDYQEDEDGLVDYLSLHGTGGRTFLQLLEAMLVDSEEEAAEIMQDWVEDRVSVKDIFARWSTLETTYTPRRTTAEEISKIFEGLYQGFWLLPGEQALLLDLMSEYSSGDDTRLGLIKEFLPEDYSFFNKRGSIVKGRVVVADVAVIEMGDRAYVIALFGYLREDNTPTYDVLEATIEEVAPLIWEYLNQQ